MRAICYAIQLLVLMCFFFFVKSKRLNALSFQKILYIDKMEHFKKYYISDFIVQMRTFRDKTQKPQRNV